MSPTSGPGTGARAGRPWSLERKLPLLMTALLAVMLAVTLGLTYATLTRSATAVAAARLQRAADQLGTSVTTATTGLRTRLAAAARDSTFGRALAASAAPGSADGVAASALAAARVSLDSLLSRNDTGLTVELWAADGRRLAFAGRDVRADGRAPRPGSETAELFVLPPGFDALRQSDSAQVGALYIADGVPHFWVVAPVLVEGARAGYLARQYRIAQGQQADQTIRALAGADVGSYYRNADGGVWITIAGGAAVAPTRRDSSAMGLMISRPEVGALLAVERAIPGTPLVLALELPVRSVLVAPRATLRRLALASVLLLVVGATAALFLSRRITRPLAVLTGAAESVAQGQYGTRVAVEGGDELARLASSFNHMAAEVGAAHDELEMQTEEAQSTAEELDQSNRELGVALRDLEERESQFRDLADAIPQLSWMAHADGTIFWYNERWYAYTGSTPEAMQGWGWQGVHDPALLPDVLRQWKGAIAAGLPVEMTFPLRGADGRFRWFLTRVRPVRDGAGQVVRWFGTNTDIHALREAREAAEAARTDAEAARAQAEEARRAAEAANRAKSEFLAVMSHELRTPLNAIGGYTELLELELRGPVTEAQRRDLDRIRTSQQHLLGLISGVLDLSRIEAGRVSYDLVPIQLDPFLAVLDSLVEPQAVAKSLALAYQPCAPGLAALADREKLRQILLNLLSNAIRYTPSGGRVAIAAEAHDDATVAITVRDTGIGIAPDALERIFEPFVQLDRSLTQGREGVGLGLAISRDLAHGMGGGIAVESQLGEGSCFTLTLPRATLREGETRAPRSGEFPVVDGEPSAERGAWSVE